MINSLANLKEMKVQLKEIRNYYSDQSERHIIFAQPPCWSLCNM